MKKLIIISFMALILSMNVFGSQYIIKYQGKRYRAIKSIDGVYYIIDINKYQRELVEVYKNDKVQLIREVD